MRKQEFKGKPGPERTTEVIQPGTTEPLTDERGFAFPDRETCSQQQQMVRSTDTKSVQQTSAFKNL